MKYAYIFLLTIVVATGLSSCKKEKDPYDTRNIVGKWFMQKQIFTQTRDNLQYNQETTTDFGGAYLQFNQDNSGVFVSGNNTVEFKWNILRDNLTVTQRVGDQTVVLYTAYVIKKLNSSELNMEAQSNYTKEDRAAYKDLSDEYYTR